MKKVKDTLEFNAQRLADLMEQGNVRTCSVVTTLKNTESVQTFCRALCDKMSESGKSTAFCLAGEKPEGEGACLVAAFHPDEDMASFRACLESDGVIFVERYGVTGHKALEEVVELLRDRGANLLGVFGLKD